MINITIAALVDTADNTGTTVLWSIMKWWDVENIWPQLTPMPHSSKSLDYFSIESPGFGRFWGTPIFGNPHIYIYTHTYVYIYMYIYTHTYYIPNTSPNPSRAKQLSRFQRVAQQVSTQLLRHCIPDLVTVVVNSFGGEAKSVPNKITRCEMNGKAICERVPYEMVHSVFFVFSADTKNQTSDHSHADSPLFTLEIETSETMNLLFKDLTLFWTYFYSVIVWFRYFKICSCTLPIFRIFLSFPKIDWCARPVLARLVDVTWSPGRDHCRKGGFMVYPMNTHVTYTYIHK